MSVISYLTPDDLLDYGVWMAGGMTLLGAFQLQAGDQSGGVPFMVGVVLFTILYGFRSAFESQSREARDSDE